MASHHYPLLLFPFLSLLALSSLTPSAAAAAIDEAAIPLLDEVFGLIAFKSDLVDPLSHLASWNQDDDSPCSWQYVACNPSSRRVSSISLDSLSLSGKLGRGLQKLTRLKSLSLSGNNISGSIPPSLNLPSLQFVNLSRNSLSGAVPASFVGMDSLKFLDLSYNLLSGNLPEDLFRNCSSLRWISVAGNSVEGSIPATLYGCSVLNTVVLSGNRFSGSPDFSSGFWSLSRLRTLDLSGNSLSGSVPEGVFRLRNLKVLRLQGNGFAGKIPWDLGLSPHLNWIDFSDNEFTGPIPEYLRRLRSLSYLSFSNNLLTGGLPDWIGELTRLKYLDLSYNGLAGGIPSSIVSCSELSVIRLRGNNFTGSIPDHMFTDLGSLVEVDFSRNQLVGTLPPASPAFFNSIQNLDLSGNHLTGLHILTGNEPISSGLKHLNMSWNDLRSTLPLELGHLQNLEVLDLRNSAVNGSLPADLCESGKLAILQLDGNSLSGPIPEEIGNCSSLYLLSLSHNNLTGSVPSSISKLRKLEFLKLEFNSLTGELPKELGALENLLALNVSHNQLVGRLPDAGIFPNLDASALQDNLGICSPLLKGPCKMNVPKPLVLDPFARPGDPTRNRNRNPELSPSSSSSSSHGMFLTVSAITAICAAAFIGVGVVVVTLLNASARKRLAFVEHALESMCSSSVSKSSGNLAGAAGTKLVLFDSKSSSWIRRHLTDDETSPETLLSKAAEIGEGELGTVYKLHLGSTERTVAVKKLDGSKIVQFADDFERELRLLGKVKHQNLLSLKGYYWTPRLQLVISDFAANGSLQAKLHERPPSSPALNWAERFNILSGTARGLAHLHHGFRPPVIHYNVKPSNVLLDGEMNAKVSDYGLTRLLTRPETHAVVVPGAGYAAPEVACRSLRVNEKCDVYGYGVVALEVVTGRRPVEYGEDSVVILSDHVRGMLEEGNVLECVDPAMGEGSWPEEEVLPVLKLALVCTSHVPSSRPSMAEVVQILQVIRTSLP